MVKIIENYKAKAVYGSKVIKNLFATMERLEKEIREVTAKREEKQKEMLPPRQLGHLHDFLKQKEDAESKAASDLQDVKTRLGATSDQFQNEQDGEKAREFLANFLDLSAKENDAVDRWSETTKDADTWRTHATKLEREFEEKINKIRPEVEMFERQEAYLLEVKQELNTIVSDAIIFKEEIVKEWGKTDEHRRTENDFVERAEKLVNDALSI